MCGIVGVISKLNIGMTVKMLDALDEMLFADQLRGTDGTGVFWDNKTGEAKYLKEAVTGGVFINNTEWKKATSTILSESTFAIGHNRAATRGKSIQKNTHPFQENHITLVHNGTLHNHHGLTKEHVEVDSHAICHSLVKNGVEDTIKELNGAFALVWYDELAGTINLCRNKERPLNLVEFKDCWIICSEAGLGAWIGTRNNQKFIGVTEVPVATLITFNTATPQEYTKTNLTLYTPKWDTYYNNKEGKDTYRDTAKYRIGDKIRFSASGVVTTNTSSYLKGYLLKDQSRTEKVEDKGGNWNLFENSTSVMFYSKLDVLNNLAMRNNLVGTILTSTNKNGKDLYYVKDVMEWEPPKILQLPQKKSNVTCDYCGVDIFGKEYDDNFGCTICYDCHHKWVKTGYNQVGAC